MINEDETCFKGLCRYIFPRNTHFMAMSIANVPNSFKNMQGPARKAFPLDIFIYQIPVSGHFLFSYKKSETYVTFKETTALPRGRIVPSLLFDCILLLFISFFYFLIC